MHPDKRRGPETSTILYTYVNYLTLCAANPFSSRDLFTNLTKEENVNDLPRATSLEFLLFLGPDCSEIKTTCQCLLPYTKWTPRGRCHVGFFKGRGNLDQVFLRFFQDTRQKLKKKNCPGFSSCRPLPFWPSAADKIIYSFRKFF